MAPSAPLEPPTLAELHVLAAAGISVCRIALARMSYRAAVDAAVAAMWTLVQGSAVEVPLPPAPTPPAALPGRGAPPSGAPATLASGPGGGEGSEGGGTDGTVAGPAPSVVDGVLEARQQLGPSLGLPAWLWLRTVVIKGLLLCGPGHTGPAAAVAEVALAEAMAGSDHLAGHRLLCLRAEVALFAGDLPLASTALDAVCRKAGGPLLGTGPGSGPAAVFAGGVDSLGPSPLTTAHALTLRAVLGGSSDTGRAPSTLAACLADLLAAEALVRALLVHQGWDGRYVDDVSDACPPRAMVDSLYRPAVPLLAAIRARIGAAYSAQAGAGAASAVAGAGAASGSSATIVSAAAAAGVGAASALRVLEVRKWAQARATLRHAVFPNPVTIARVLEGLGRARRLVGAITTQCLSARLTRCALKPCMQAQEGCLPVPMRVLCPPPFPPPPHTLHLPSASLCAAAGIRSGRIGEAGGWCGQYQRGSAPCAPLRPRSHATDRRPGGCGSHWTRGQWPFAGPVAVHGAGVAVWGAAGARRGGTAHSGGGLSPAPHSPSLPLTTCLHSAEQGPATPARAFTA